MSEWTNISELSVAPWNLILRAFVVYIWVLLLVRISGKRQIGQMGATEFVAILLISNAVQNAMNAGDNSLTGGIILATVLIFLSWGIAKLTYRSKKFQVIFEGTPTLLVHRGKVLQAHLAKEEIRMSELLTLLRKQGVHSLNDVETAILESDGTLSVTRPAEGAQHD